ncbi:MAG: dynamin family protein [Anaerolineae bacterium]|nr:dynamin family protein [Anaerolineae bacterium]
MHHRILNENQEAILGIERHWLTRLQLALARFDAVSADDRASLEQSIRQLDELFLLVIVGEFNAGKSAFINALLGKKLLQEGVTPTTTRVHLLKYGQKFERVAVEAEASVDVFTAPALMLEQINIVDTPGTNAIYREHEAITQEFIPRSDMVLFVTSVDRPFTESERAFLESIRNWGKKVVIVLNKIDILDDPQDINDILVFIEENGRALLGFTPKIFPVSARIALQAKQVEDMNLLAKSRFEVLEQYILATLDEKERIRLKLSNPIGVSTHLIDKYTTIMNERLELLRDDFTVMEDIERQVAMYREDMGREFGYRLSDVENVLHEFENRGIAYFDDTMRLTRIFDLLDKHKLQRDFEDKVVNEVPEIIESRVDDIIDWLIASNLKQWQAVMEHVRTRKEEHADRIVGQVGGTFDYDRVRVLETVSRIAQQALQNYDEVAESRRIASSLQMAVAGTALVEVGAIGLGAIITALATTAAADLTGILAAGTVAVLGLLVIPTQRRQVKQELREKIESVREELIGALSKQFERELERSLEEIEGAVAPYTRFIRAERTHLNNALQEFLTIRGWLARQLGEIELL